MTDQFQRFVIGQFPYESFQNTVDTLLGIKPSPATKTNNDNVIRNLGTRQWVVVARYIILQL